MRKFNLVDKTWGDTGFFVIRLDGQLWEPLWVVLQESVRWRWVGESFLHVQNRDIWEDAMHGYSIPLLRALKTPPSVTLLRCPPEMSLCRQRATCPSFEASKCNFASKDSPICYDVDEEDEALRLRLQEIRDAWREGRYGLIVPDSYDI